MALMRGAQKLNHLIRSANGIQALPLLLRDSPRHHFSTESQLPPESQHSSSPIDPFLQPPSGVVYGKLRGISVNTHKTDVLNLFDECKLTLDDIKADYTRNFQLMSMLVQFPSLSDFNAAFRTLNRKGRLFRLEKTDRREWDFMIPYNGRYVLLQGIPRNALVDDVERFLSGCNYDSSSLEMFSRAAQPDLIRMAKVRFPSQIEAMNAVIRKTGTFCLNSRIVVRPLQ